MIKIGIPVKQYEDDIGLPKELLSWVSEFGTPVLISPISLDEYKEVYSFLDAVVLPGGADVNPQRYKKVPFWYTYKSDVFLEHFDTQILPYLVECEKPIFGICRGLQTLNVHFGGSLIQHLFSHPYSDSGEDLVHQVITTERKELKTNSFHHQAVGMLGTDLLVLASSKEDNIVEAISHKTLPIRAVQWHPERFYDEFSESLFWEIL